MKTKKPDRSVAQMAVLKDIRGLLSITREQAPPVETSPKTELDIQAEKVGFEEQLKQYEELVRKQQAALDRLEAEKKAGTMIEVWASSDSTGGIALVEEESNDALHEKINEVPYYPFMQFTVTPLTDMKLAFRVGQNFLKKMVGK